MTSVMRNVLRQVTHRIAASIDSLRFCRLRGNRIRDPRSCRKPDFTGATGLLPGGR